MSVGASQHVRHSFNTRKVPRATPLHFNHLLEHHIWHEPCLVSERLEQEFHSEFGDMARAQSASLAFRAFRSVPFVELRQSLPSQIAIISPFVDQLMHFIARFRTTPDESELGIETALHEALANAIVHGNQEDPRKLVRVACRCTTDGEVFLTIQDEGRGFDSAAVDPTTPENRLLPHGRGIYLMKTLMDDVCFEQGGAVVYMHKGPNARPRAARKSG